MLKVFKKQDGEVLQIKLVGEIGDTTNLSELVGPPAPLMEIYCQEVSRINSAGVKSWIIYFRSCQASGAKVRFLECSMPLVEQMNQISNFTCGGTVESIYVPFMCENCKHQFMKLFSVNQLKNISYVIPPFPCESCQGQASFDDDVEEYFYYFQKS